LVAIFTLTCLLGLLLLSVAVPSPLAARSLPFNLFAIDFTGSFVLLLQPLKYQLVTVLNPRIVPMFAP
jgi:hypothetical protein